MSLSSFKELLSGGGLTCPECGKAVTGFEKYVDLIESVWDGPGDSNFDSSGASKVTLICGNDPCAWKERTEYWQNYLGK